jgi:hypothetical protein
MAMHNAVASDLRSLLGKRLASPMREHINSRAEIDERQFVLPANQARGILCVAAQQSRLDSERLP